MCDKCDSGTLLQCGCVSCTSCTFKCTGCTNTVCISCVQSCMMCDKFICKDCINVMTTCKCCDKVLPFEQHGIVCVDCVIRDWFSDCGYSCTACEQHCSAGKICKIRAILDTQEECPICWEKLNNNYTLQLCELHKVCNHCQYDTNHGCPICRTGKKQ